MKIISSEEKLRNSIFRVTEDHAVDPDGFEIRRAIVQHGGSAVMLAADRRKRVLLVRQYRLPARQRLWELPAGRLDPGETPLRAARRELAEETGYRARKWKKLVSFYPSPGFLAERMTIFVATDLIAGEPHNMEDERIESRWFSRKEMEEMIRRGGIVDGKTILGFLVWSKLR
ncbi:MAG: NUDIX hydrolase [Bryobacteraceae bacterium]|jgi:ADP-ribose pyrophosphatase